MWHLLHNWNNLSEKKCQNYTVEQVLQLLIVLRAFRDKEVVPVGLGTEFGSAFSRRVNQSLVYGTNIIPLIPFLSHSYHILLVS